MNRTTDIAEASAALKETTAGLIRLSEAATSVQRKCCVTSTGGLLDYRCSHSVTVQMCKGKQFSHLSAFVFEISFGGFFFTFHLFYDASEGFVTEAMTPEKADNEPHWRFLMTVVSKIQSTSYQLL